MFFQDHITFYFIPISSVETIILPFSYILKHSAQLPGHKKWTEFNTKNRSFSEYKKWNSFRNNKDIK